MIFLKFLNIKAPSEQRNRNNSHNCAPLPSKCLGRSGQNNNNYNFYQVYFDKNCNEDMARLSKAEKGDWSFN